MRPRFGASLAPLSSPTRPYSVFLFAGFLLALAASTSGCEDQAIGRTCKTLADMSKPTEAEFNPEALECPSRLCIKPAYESGSLQEKMTQPFCTAECSKNSDCEDGEKRSESNPNDKRCTGKFVCAVPFTTGPLKCQKMCVCGDFFKDPKTASAVPASCQGS